MRDYNDNGRNVIETKSFEFAVRIVKFSKWLKSEYKEFEIANQMLRSGTSIGANIAEAQYAQSKNDFYSKMQIALKEAYETEYWLRLIVAAGIVSIKDTKSLKADLKEILKLLISITKTAKITK